MQFSNFFDKKYNSKDNSVSVYRFILDNINLSDTCLISNDKEVTYKELFDLSDKVADILYSYGFRKKDIILTQIHGTVESVALLLACSKIGVTSMMLTETVNIDLMEELVDRYKIRFVFIMGKFFLKYIDHSYIDKCDKVIVMPLDGSYYSRNKVVSNIMSWETFIENNIIENGVEVENGHYDMNVCFTSGSTGKPKQIVHSNDNIVSLIKMCDKHFTNWQKGLTYATIFPFYLTSGQSFNLFLLLYKGVKLYLKSDSSLESFVDLVSKNKVDIILLVKFVLMEFIKILDSKIDLSCLKFVYSVGGDLKLSESETINKFLSMHKSSAKVESLYGLSETNSLLMYHKCFSDNKCVYNLVDGIDVKVVDTNTKKECVNGKRGLLFFKSPSIMNCYLINNEVNRDLIKTDKDLNEWYETDDIGIKDDNGNIIVFGRIKELFYIDGKELYAFDVKEYILKIDGVLDSELVFGSDKSLSKIFLILSEKDKVTCDEIVSKIISDINNKYNVKLDSSIVILIDKIPLNKSGKIDYLALQEIVKEK